MTKATDSEPHESVEAHSKLFRDLLLGFVKVHVLHHASKEPVYGAGILAELETHGYRLSWGTLYPLLHNLDAADFLRRENHVVAGKVRKYYQITPLGQRALDETRDKAKELLQEITDSDDVRGRSARDRLPADSADDVQQSASPNGSSDAGGNQLVP